MIKEFYGYSTSGGDVIPIYYDKERDFVYHLYEDEDGIWEIEQRVGDEYRFNYKLNGKSIIDYMGMHFAIPYIFKYFFEVED